MDKTGPGANLAKGASFFSLSLLVHVVAAASIAFYFANTTPAEFDDSQEYIDLGYEQFDEPPAETPAPPRPTTRNEVTEAAPEPQPTKMDTSPRELQDESSTIAGTQEAKPAPLATAAPGSGTSVADVPYYKIKPKYPRDALLAGVEGFVDLKIDVREDGSVDNIRSVGGRQADMFESEARRAVAKWKYKPFINEAGHPIRKADHQVRVEFKLQESETL
ncbi:MAG: TonB family protein [Bdellovibrionaceae bacterium]|nr:TonB family protein [Pseudobdellovibrionaceae bacterium]